jgi:hypothetical protein
VLLFLGWQEVWMMAWFDEPTTEDNRALRREQPFAWLKRSTTPRARVARAVLNRNIDQLPEGYQPVVVRHMRDHWVSGHFELIVARTLQLLGAELEVEQATASGSRPDFLAHFVDHTVTVEAVSPVIDGDAARVAAHHSPLLDLLEKAVPAGWSLLAWDVPLLAEHDSRGAFKQAVHKLLGAIQPPGVGATPIDLEHEFPTGYLRMRLLPKEYDRPIVLEPRH